MLKTRASTRSTERSGLPVLVTVFLLLATWILMPNQASGHEMEVNLPVGAIVRMYSVCDAYGANEVAKANLMAGDREAGNKTFVKLRDAEPQHCWSSKVPVQLKVEEITYAGTAGNNLHVYIVRFEGEELYGVMTGSHPPVPEPKPAGFTI